jgi:hypothetical protein
MATGSGSMDLHLQKDLQMVEITAFNKNLANEWDSFCNQCIQATFLHTQRFITYHGSKFRDRSLVIKEKNKIIGLFPAAELPSDCSIIVSHPGITYGGLLHCGALIGEDAIQAFQSIATWYSGMGYKRLIYKAIPKIYHQVPCDDDIYALFRQGALKERVDLSSSINLNNRRSISKRRERSLNRAEKSGVYVSQELNLLGGMWKVLEDNLMRRHSAKPVHSLPEIIKLAELFPKEIKCTCAFLEKELIAGVVTFSTKTCMHAQYIASNQCGYDHSALDLVFNNLIAEATENKQQWFDFGISNENDGKILNAGLYNFKTEFGGGGIIHEHYELKL